MPLAAVAGTLILAYAWAGPLAALARASFTAHMSLHMTVVAVAAPLIAAGFARGVSDPVRWAPRLFSPIPASGVELAVVWAWHLPALHHATRAHSLAFAAEQLSFLISGLLLWMSVLGGAPSSQVARAPASLAALALTLGHMTLLGVLMSLSPRPLYRHRVLDPEALLDQQRGGAVMLVISTIACVAGGLVVGRRLMHTSARAGLEDA